MARRRPGRFSVQRKFRLTKSTDFKRVRRQGKSYAHPLVVLIALQNASGEQTRFGVAAGRSVGNAVQRNRAKRLIRAGLQSFLDQVAAGWDVIILARRPLAEASYQDTLAALATLLKRAHLLQENHAK